MAEFKDRLKELRKEKGITQQQLADLMGKTESLIRKYENGTTFPASSMAYQRYEKGQREPNNGTLIGLAEFFNVSTDYLLGLSDIRKFEFDLSEITTIQEKMKQLRSDKGYSYSKLSELTGLTKSTLQRYETGAIAKIPIDAIKSIANAFQVSPSEVMNLEEKEVKSLSDFSTDELLEEIKRRCNQ